MAESRSEKQCFFKIIYDCGDGKLINSTRIQTILSASEIRQDNIRLDPDLLDGTDAVQCHQNCISKYVSPNTLHRISKREHDDELQCDENDDPKCLR